MIGESIPTTLDVETTPKDRYQTTAPETVRRALRLIKGDKIHYTIRPSGEAVLTRAVASDGDDRERGHLLCFLAQDIANSPECLKTVDTNFV
mgnify:FL=1